MIVAEIVLRQIVLQVGLAAMRLLKTQIAMTPRATKARTNYFPRISTNAALSNSNTSSPFWLVP